jgi:hypothetical protein
MRRVAWLMALVLLLCGCGRDDGDKESPSLSAPTEASALEEESLAGLDFSDHELIAGGLKPVRTLTAACSLLFDGRDVPALAVGFQPKSGEPLDAHELSDILMSVAYSAPDALRDDAGALVDHLDLQAKDLDSESRSEAQGPASRLTAHCDAAEG